MRNITNSDPTKEIHGRLLGTVNFVEDQDLRGKEVLDIGCGFGWFEVNVKGGNIKKIVGTEMSEGDLETARRYVKNEKVSFTVGNALNLPFKDESFDTVVSWEVLEHVPVGTENRMFREARRVLRKNGVFYLSTPHKSFVANVFDPAWWLVKHRHYREKDLINLVTNNDFKLEQIVQVGGRWELIGVWNLYIAKWIFRRDPFFIDYINRKQDLEYAKGNKGFCGLFLKCRAV
jgi:ubiquinone/menaquinone biosynthesis C-methylase UbiE